MTAPSTPQRVRVDDTAVDEREDVTYQGVPFTGVVYDTADDGTLITEKSYHGGREDGPQREWYDNGSPESEYEAAEGVVVGLALDWHPNGQLARRQRFDRFGQLRHREVWDEQGTARPDQAFDWPEGAAE